MNHTLNEEEYKLYLNQLEELDILRSHKNDLSKYKEDLRKKVKSYLKNFKYQRKHSMQKSIDSSEYVLFCQHHKDIKDGEEDQEYWCDYCLWNEVLGFCPYGYEREYSQ
jgi:hypothetical protein